MDKKNPNQEPLSEFNKNLITAITYKEKAMAKSTNPRISVNKLAEYLEATSVRRKKIVYDAKYPAKGIVARYKDAREAIKSYITVNRNEDFILGVISTIEAKTAGSDWQENDNASSIKALELLLDVDLAVLEGCEIRSCSEDNKLVTISGVDISVNPDLVLTKTVGGIVHVGAIKLHISKSNELSEESQKVVGTMIYNYVGDNIVQRGQVADLKLSMSFDIFKQSIECAPTAYKSRMKKIEAACEEISLWWDKV